MFRCSARPDTDDRGMFQELRWWHVEFEWITKPLHVCCCVASSVPLKKWVLQCVLCVRRVPSELPTNIQTSFIVLSIVFQSSSKQFFRIWLQVPMASKDSDGAYVHIVAQSRCVRFKWWVAWRRENVKPAKRSFLASIAPTRVVLLQKYL